MGVIIILPGMRIYGYTKEFHNWLIKNADKRCKADIEFSEKMKENKYENNTRAIRQEE